MDRVVFDTNVYISALITPRGRADTVYQMAIDGEFQLFSSIAILTELAGKLQHKFKWETDHVAAAVRHIAVVATVVKPTCKIEIVADDPDNRILECAVTAGASAIITGDRHLLELVHEGVNIITIAEFTNFHGPG